MSSFAGYAGAIQAMRAWCQQRETAGEPLPAVTPGTKAEFVDMLKAKFEAIGERPTAMVLGAKGRYARYSQTFCWRIPCKGRC